MDRKEITPASSGSQQQPEQTPSGNRRRKKRRRSKGGRPQQAAAPPRDDVDLDDVDLDDIDLDEIDEPLWIEPYGTRPSREEEPRPPEPRRAAPPPPRPARAKPPAAKSPPARPAAEKPAGQKPPAQKLPAQRPPVAKPAEQRSAIQKPADQRPAAEKPPAQRRPAKKAPEKVPEKAATEKSPAPKAPPQRTVAEKAPPERRPAPQRPAPERPRPEKAHVEKTHAERPTAKKPLPESAEAAPPEPLHEAPAAARATPRAKPKVLPPSGFTPLDLSETMLHALAAAGYVDPTPVQAGLIPRALAGADVMAQAQTGTGKTAAFAIPIIERLQPHRKSSTPQALVMVPTRELAVQVRDECVKLSAGRTLGIVAVYGGKPIRGQIEHLNQGAELIVGTPGRVLDLMSRSALRLGELTFVVLDEADRMLDIGFRPDIEKILRHCPASRQTLLLSATIPPPVKRLAERYMREPESLDFSPKNLAVETIEQFYFSVDPERKFDLLVKLLEREQPPRAIIFCRTKRGTDKIYQRLAKRHYEVDTIHGDLMQAGRDRVMKAFREGKVRWLVATDVVGRGIDVSGVSHIINYDIPQFSDDYVHRVGRTGRMGREGVAYTFVAPEEGNELTRIEMRINRLLKRDEIPGFQAFGRPKETAPLGQPVEPGDGTAPAAAEGESPAPRPVFGRATKRFRRAL